MRRSGKRSAIREFQGWEPETEKDLIGEQNDHVGKTESGSVSVEYSDKGTE